MDARIGFLDKERIAAQVIHPTLGLLWEEAVTDPKLADSVLAQALQHLGQFRLWYMYESVHCIGGIE